MCIPAFSIPNEVFHFFFWGGVPGFSNPTFRIFLCALGFSNSVFRVLVFRRSGFKYSGVPAFRRSGVPAFRRSSVPAFQHSGLPPFQLLVPAEKVYLSRNQNLSDDRLKAWNSELQPTYLSSLISPYTISSSALKHWALFCLGRLYLL